MELVRLFRYSVRRRSCALLIAGLFAIGSGLTGIALPLNAEPADTPKATTQATNSSSNSSNKEPAGRADPETEKTTEGETASPETEESAAADEPPPEDPDSRALLMRAEEHYYRGRHHIALKLLQLVIEREPEHPLAYRYAGDIYLKRGDLDEAEEHLQIARELSSRPEREWFRLGQVAYLREDAEAATAAFRQALELRPDFALCRLYLGFVSFRLDRDKAATVEHWTAFRKLAPDHEQGPAVDRALAVLQNPDYEIPAPPAEEDEDAEKEVELPESADGKETRVPYKPGKEAEGQSENDGAEIMNIDDL